MEQKTVAPGDVFGRLTVIETHMHGRGGTARVRCICGKEQWVRISSLTNPKLRLRSCGCLRRDMAAQVWRRTHEDDICFGTQFDRIEKTEAYKNSKTGIRGVCVDKRSGKYEAYVSLKGRKVYLGRYSDIKDAIRARDVGCKKYYSPLIEARKALHASGEGL